MPDDPLPHSESFRNQLAALQVALEAVHFENLEHRDRVSAPIAALEEKLLDESLMSGDEFLLHELRLALQEFEDDHPALTEIVGRMADLLAKIGL